MNINRIISKRVKDQFFSGKTIVLIGPRQTGKTTLIKNILTEYDSFLFLDGDDREIQDILEISNTQQLKRIIGNHTIVFIGEAQRIKQIGLTAKIIHDQFRQVQLILSGSSALDLNNAINEPLTGRKWEYQLFPISWEEFQNHFGYLTAMQQLEDRLIYGMYPDVINHIGKEKEVLYNLTESYLYKDILALANIKKPELLDQLLKALAYQVTSEVSYNELSRLLGINKETVSNYINLLEKAFVVFKLPSYSRNLKNEIKTNQKIYFYDNGVRNAVIKAYNPITFRDDKGALWENFLIAERIKYLSYHQKYTNYYFWRNKQQQEVDWVEERNQELYAYEFKWKAKGKIKFPKSFIESYYPQIQQVIDRDNFVDFLAGEL